MLIDIYADLMIKKNYYYYYFLAMEYVACLRQEHNKSN